jgi:hypothetical protein
MVFVMAKVGRPSTYTPEIAAKICEGLATGKLLPQVCKATGMPCPRTVMAWLIAHPEFSQQYARAKEIQCEQLATKTLEIADKVRKGERVRVTIDKDGNKTAEKTTADMVDRARLMVDTRKWLLSKMFPKKYGDRPVDTERTDRLDELMSALRPAYEPETPGECAPGEGGKAPEGTQVPEAIDCGELSGQTGPGSCG